MDHYLYGGDLFCSFVFLVYVYGIVHVFFQVDFTRYSILPPASFGEYWGGMGIVGVCWEAGWFVGAVAGGWQAVAGDKPPRYIDRGSDSRFFD